jgi:mRNA interferase RelE/StbE
LQKLPSEIAVRVFAKIEALAREPRPRGCQKLRGNNALWRIRVGDYRVLYEIKDHNRLVDVIAIGNRQDIYRG